MAVLSSSLRWRSGFQLRGLSYASAFISYVQRQIGYPRSSIRCFRVSLNGWLHGCSSSSEQVGRGQDDHSDQGYDLHYLFSVSNVSILPFVSLAVHCLQNARHVHDACEAIIRNGIGGTFGNSFSNRNQQLRPYGYTLVSAGVDRLHVSNGAVLGAFSDRWNLSSYQ